MRRILLSLILALSMLNINAQTEYGFKAVEVLNSFEINPFTYFLDAPILAAGDKDSYNAMTIGWGGMGTLWGRNRPVVTVYVAPKRFTHQFMEKSRYFTVMQFSDINVVQYMGKHSGRDGDKAKALGLHVAYTKNGTPYFKEADAVIECEVMYAAPFEEKNFRNDVPKKTYSNFPAGIHSMYIGEVVGVWKK
ncbi:flavin reductase family protein [Prevotella veroralis]|uniref:flavin reductase family protein n=1 Tax=Prevotella veroralis TaxID=28137 RepID=UPI00039D3B07|nr:flavin reductase [Prevotella veroralis]